MVSRSSGQVAHVLLTRSPLGLQRCCHRMDLVRLACVKHAASVRPEPGSNSPSRPSPQLLLYSNRPQGLSLYIKARAMAKIGEPAVHYCKCSIAFADWHSTDCCPYSANYFRFDPKSACAPADRPHWLLAFTIPFSRNDRHSPGGVGAGARWHGLPVYLGPVIVGVTEPRVKGPARGT